MDKKDFPQIGDKMPDGSVYAGISPDTGEVLYAMPQNAPLTLKWKNAVKYNEKINQENTLGHSDWRVPSRAELNHLYENQNKGALATSFNKAKGHHPDWYWSSDLDTGAARGRWSQLFTNGLQCWVHPDVPQSTLLVRSVNRLAGC